MARSRPMKACLGNPLVPEALSLPPPGVEFGGWAASCRALNLRLRDTAAQEAAAAEALKDVLVRLGPAFVKIGQALSSRPDVLPPAYIGALEALQDRIPPFPDAAAMADHHRQGKSVISVVNILTMEWIDGERLRTAGTSAAERGATGAPSSTRTFSAPASAAALDARRLEDLALVEVGVRCSLEQMLEEGFYHADPHPGNLLRTPDGRLAYLDFGMMGQIDEKTRNALMTATLHLVNREYGRLAEDFVALGLLPPGTDRESVMPALTGVFSEALQGGVSNLSFGTLSSNLGVTMYNFRIPPYYTLLVRSLSVLEGIALAADPNYKSTGRFRFDRLESLLRQAAKSATRLKRPAVAPPSAPASASAADGTTSSGPSMPQGGGALLLLLSTDGEFVRGILLDEVAKGIDGACRIAADAALDAVRSSVAALPAPAVPLLALLPGAPLAALGVLGAALTSALARLPSLANADDRAQVAGLLQLGNALADVAGLKAAAAVRWLAEEAAALPPDARGELLQLPLQLGSRLAGRFTARTLRSLVVATSGSSLPPDALERELMRREEAAADLVPPAAA
eukprot:XP_001693677.1 predicted protein [Chlamydomonas reinhardtii]